MFQTDMCAAVWKTPRIFFRDTDKGASKRRRFGPGSSTTHARGPRIRNNNHIKEKKLKIKHKCLVVALAVVFTLFSAHAQDASDSALRAKSQSKTKEEQAKAAAAEKKLRELFWKRLDEAFLEQLGTPAYTPPDPNAPNTRRIPPPPFDSPPFPSGDW